MQVHERSHLPAWKVSEITSFSGENESDMRQWGNAEGTNYHEVCRGISLAVSNPLALSPLDRLDSSN